MPPNSLNGGNVGGYVEHVMSNAGYDIDHTGVIDIPKLGVDIKTKCIESNSPWSIGSMTVKKIIKYDYDSSPLKRKFQQIYAVKHSQIFRTITNTEILNCSKDFFQEKVRHAYNSARNKMIAGCRDPYIRGDDESWGYLENKKKNKTMTNSWELRIPVSSMRKLEGIAKSNFDNLFE